MSQINPSNTRAQKLKKLYQISRELIREYGYGYFLRVAFEELFTQKGKLFSPDTIPQNIKLFESLNFVKEGVLRDKLWRNRKWHDSYIYSKLSTDK